MNKREIEYVRHPDKTRCDLCTDRDFPIVLVLRREAHDPEGGDVHRVCIECISSLCTAAMTNEPVLRIDDGADA